MKIASEDVYFQKLWAQYPLGPSYPHHDDSEEVKKDIGGKVNAKWIDNTCAIRISKCFNYYSGQEKSNNKSISETLKIPRGYILRSTVRDSGDKHLLDTVSGDDKHQYAYRVNDMVCYLVDLFGKPPDTAQSNGQYGVDPSIFLNKKGIIYFDVRVWGNATGHLDLWDGTSGITQTEEAKLNHGAIYTMTTGSIRHHSYFGISKAVWLWKCR